MRSLADDRNLVVKKTVKKFTYESNEKEIPFLGLKFKLNKGKISADLY